MIHKIRLATLVVILSLPGLGKAQEESRIFPYSYEVKDLDNGLRVIVIPTDYPNIVSLQIPVQVGSRNEVEPGKSGFAHLFEHVMFRGTKRFSSEEYNAILKKAGASHNAYTTDDMTNYHVTFSKEDLETILMLEADRFQNLEYSMEDFKTESRAVLGEYNKNFSDPFRKLMEAQRSMAFMKHTYRHTTMGFIEDIEKMPDQYLYSLQFFNRYYRPEKTALILAGDLDPGETFDLVEKYWGGWKRGDFEAEIPEEPESEGPISTSVDWPSPTLPWIMVAFHGPAFSEKEKDMPTMDVVQQYAFSQSSSLYEKLVIKEQKVDQLFPYFPDHNDPYLLTVAARVKDATEVAYVRDEILKAFARLRSETVSPGRLSEIKGNLKYRFANRMDNSEAIAGAIVGYVGRTRDPQTINRVYRLYDEVTAADVQTMANKYFTDQNLVVVTLSNETLPEAARATGSVDSHAGGDLAQTAEVPSVLNRGDSPIVNIRFLFKAGAALDPLGQEGLAQLTAAMITRAGSRNMSYEAIQKALFPMASSFFGQVDKEMTVFTGQTHRDNLRAYYEIVSQQLLHPAWDESDFRRVKSNLINYVALNLRDNNDEELGKEVLYEMIYEDHPYGHLTMGHVDALEKLTLEDVKMFYGQHYTRANLLLGLAGGFDDEFLNRVNRDLSGLPPGRASAVTLPEPGPVKGFDVQIIKKETRATAISFGFPIEVNRAHPDFTALWLVRSYFGEHRSQNGRLMQRMRELRGLNYGDYAYIEYFPGGMFQFEPDPNLARQQQIFQVWIRPVVPENAHFSLRLAMYELDKLISDGMSAEDFEATRNYLTKFVNILTKTQGQKLGYDMDSHHYGIPEFAAFVRQNLEKLTLQEVNRVIKTHLQNENVKFAVITSNAEELREQLLKNAPSPIVYDAERPAEILAEDRIVQSYSLSFQPDRVRIRQLADVFRAAGAASRPTP